MERLSIFPENLEGKTKQAIGRFAQKYEVFKRNMPEKDINKMMPEILKRYERSGKAFVSTEELLDISTPQSTFSKDELKSFCERQSSLGTGERNLRLLWNYRTTTAGVNTEYRRNLLTYDTIVWMRAKDMTTNFVLSNGTYHLSSGEEDEGIPIMIPAENISLVDGEFIEIISLNTFKQFYENSNNYYDWIEDTEALHEFVGQGIFSYEKLKDTIVQYCVERIEDYNQNSIDDLISFDSIDEEDFFMHVVFKYYMLNQFVEVVDNFYSTNKSSINPLRKDIHGLIEELSFSTALDVAEQLTFQDIDPYDLIELTELILEKDQHPLLIDGNRVYITVELAEMRKYDREQDISEEFQ